ncbi:MAG TPA: hypothetical protein VL501_05085 [Pyrinomonadaceae bacterium]|nr:hypothetical protein [Pyrinomonadaceae bacterium]
MRNTELETETRREAAADQRRAFLKNSIMGGLAAAVLLPTSATTAKAASGPAACQDVGAADLLSMFSVLAFRLPNQLKATSEAIDRENKVYKDFDTLYRELVELSKQLKLKCDASAQADPRLKEIFELTRGGQDNVRYIKASSSEERELAYLQIATLTVAARQVGRSANEIPADTIAAADPDNKIICQMLTKINEMEAVKTRLDVARKESQDLFRDFRDSIGRLNKTMLKASESAAKADRGEVTTQPALSDIADAERILEDLSQKSLEVKSGMLSPDDMLKLIAVPKAMLNGQLPTNQSSQRMPGMVMFENASYEPNRADADWSRIAGIIQSNIAPTGYWTVRLLVTACIGILKLYQDPGVRRRQIYSALQADPWADSSNSNFGAAAAAIARL